MKILTVLGEKGGTGKSTMSAMFAKALSDMGIHVVAIDLDSQGHLARNLGVPASPGLAGWVMGYSTLDKVAMSVNDFLSVVPGDKTTAGAEAFLASPAMGKGVGYLRDLIRAQAIDADVVVIDTAAHGLLGAEMGHVAADLAVVPMPCRQGDANTLTGVLENFARLRASAQVPACPVLVLPNRYDVSANRRKMSDEALALMASIVDVAKSRGLDWDMLPHVSESGLVDRANVAGAGGMPAFRPNHEVARQMQTVAAIVASRLGLVEINEAFLEGVQI